MPFTIVAYRLKQKIGKSISKKLVKKGNPGIIAIPSELSNQEIDQLVCNFLSMKNPDDYTGSAVKVL